MREGPVIGLRSEEEPEMVTYVIRIYRRADASQDRAAGIAVDPETGEQNAFSNAQELWSIINRDSSAAHGTATEKEEEIKNP